MKLAEMNSAELQGCPKYVLHMALGPVCNPMRWLVFFPSRHFSDK
jgi:hypothetical protein